jgi:hypothetical protein
MTLTPGAARVILALAFVPFLAYAVWDQWLHLTARRVPLAENLLHLVLGLVLIPVIFHAFLFDWRFVAIGAVLFVPFGALDEYLFHRRLPPSEFDAHAKGHYALFAFFAVFAALVLAQRGLLPRWR